MPEGEPKPMAPDKTEMEIKKVLDTEDLSKGIPGTLHLFAKLANNLASLQRNDLESQALLNCLAALPADVKRNLMQLENSEAQKIYQLGDEESSKEIARRLIDQHGLEGILSMSAERLSKGVRAVSQKTKAGGVFDDFVNKRAAEILVADEVPEKAGEMGREAMDLLQKFVTLPRHVKAYLWDKSPQEVATRLKMDTVDSIEIVKKLLDHPELWDDLAPER